MAVQLLKQSLDVGMVTSQSESMLRLYGEILGLPQQEDLVFPGVGVIKRFKVGESTLRIVITEIEPPIKASREGFITQTGLRYITMVVSNLQEVISDCKSAGFKIPVDIRELKPGTCVAQVEDIDGNTLELMQIDV